MAKDCQEMVKDMEAMAEGVTGKAFPLAGVPFIVRTERGKLLTITGADLNKTSMAGVTTADSYVLIVRD